MDELRAAKRAEDRTWPIALRWQELEGERRANVLRIAAIAVFYAIELLNYHGLSAGPFDWPRDPTVTARFHQEVTALAVAWIAFALGIHLCLQARFFPSLLKFVSTAADLAFLTCVVCMSNGARSPLVSGYYLIIALAALRFSLPLVRGATAGALAGYLIVLGYAKWYTDRDIRVARYHEVMVLVSLVLAGVILGQVVRRAAALAADYARRAAALGKEGA